MKPGKFFLLLIVLILIQTITKAQPQNAVSNLSSISASGLSDVILIPSKTTGYSIDPSSCSEYVTIAQENGTLKISEKGNRSQTPCKVLIYVDENLRQIKSSGTSNISSDGVLTNPQLDILVSGAGDVSLQVENNSIDVGLSGSGDVQLKGKTQKLSARVSGGGDLKAVNLEAETVKVAVSGAGDAKVYAVKSLDATVSGAGDVQYKGDPEDRNVQISGMGSVRQIGSEKTITADVNITIEDKNSGDTTRLSFGNKKIIIIDEEKNIVDRIERDEPQKQTKKSKPEVKDIWTGIDFGINGWGKELNRSLSPGDKTLDLDYTRSFVCNVNPISHSFRLYKNYIALTTGLGFTFHRFMFDNNLNIANVNDQLYFIPSTIGYKKNMLKASYLTVPLMLQFVTHKNENKAFHFAFGAVAGWRMGARTKQVWDNEGSTIRTVVKDSYEMNPFRCNATVRVGYGKFNLFAEYGLTEIFRSGKGPQLSPFSAGITLTNW
jgi:hypothetical protein